MEFREFANEVEAALNDETAAARRRFGNCYYLYNGRFRGGGAAFSIYEFNTGGDLAFREECPGQLEINRDRFPCRVIGAEAGILALSTAHYIEHPIPRATLRCFPWFLLGDLKERIGEIGSPDSTFNRELVLKVFGFVASNSDVNPSSVDPLLHLVGEQFNHDQLAAIAASMTREVTFILGPPATAKTTRCGMIVRATVERGESVLVVAHSNVAVDAVTLASARALSGTRWLSGGECVRVGIPRLDEVRTLSAMIPRGIVRQRKPELLRQIESGEQRRTELRARLRQPNIGAAEREDLHEQLRSLAMPLKALEDQYATLEASVVSEAKVVVTTIWQAARCPSIHGRRFDSVLVDEASMASPPGVAFAASLAQKRVTLSGDPRQLAPIALATTPVAKKWLRRDIFNIAGITANIEAGKPDPRLEVLEVQHRMHPEIRRIISEAFYGGRLRDGERVESETTPIAALSPLPGRAIAICDVGFLQPICYKELRGRSRFNALSALACIEVARESLVSGAQSISIVTPYDCQARLISMLVRDSNMQRQIAVASVHRFQGGQSDVVILNLPDDAPQKQPGLPLQGGIDSGGARLLNVGFSRARGKLVVVCNNSFIRCTSRADSVVRLLMDKIDRSAVVEFNPTIDGAPRMGVSGIAWFTHSAMQEALRSDLREATGRVLVNTTLPSVLHVLDRALLVHLANRDVTVGVAAPAETASPDLEDNAILFEDLRTPEQFVLIGESILWCSGVALPDQQRTLFARANLPETAAVLPQMIGFGDIEPLPPPDARTHFEQALAEAVAAEPPAAPVESAEERAVARRTYFARRLAI